MGGDRLLLAAAACGDRRFAGQQPSWALVLVCDMKTRCGNGSREGLSLFSQKCWSRGVNLSIKMPSFGCGRCGPRRRLCSVASWLIGRVTYSRRGDPRAA